MRDFFTRHATADWSARSRLHLYALPSDELREAVGRYHQVLGATAAEQGLGLQPPEFLHFTVQMLHPSRDDIAPEQLAALTEALTAALAEVPPLELQIGPPVPSMHAVELWTHPVPGIDAAWGHLVDAVRSAITSVLGADVLPERGTNAVPHTSIGYGIAEGDSGRLASTLKKVRIPLITVPITEVHLLDVEQHPGQGRFTWAAPVVTIPLGDLETIEPLDASDEEWLRSPGSGIYLNGSLGPRSHVRLPSGRLVNGRALQKWWRSHA
ncbi:2'-5' RNA ligase family protein [Saccharopolyspora sp. NPDC000359]|uniref:2'-5' RNA ligase family protein n=1 Tax=Saccharopolyspora sp. NPDC000359 TaxID=3154251 RepID=UPI00332D66A2